MMEEQILEREWIPHKRQNRFLEVPDTIFEGLYGGAAGGGKSEVLLVLPIARGFIENPYFKGILFRRTFPELEKSLILRSWDFYPAAGGKYNSAIKRWKFPSGAVIDFGYCEYENDVRKYDTTEYNYMGFDELTSFTEYQYTYLTSRCRTSRKDLPAIVRGATNPGNVGHNWVRRRFVEPAPNGHVIIKDTVRGLKRIYIPAKLSDNPYLNDSDPNYKFRLELLPEADRRAKLDGDWWTFVGQVFEDFRIAPFPDEPDNARHVIPQFNIPDYYPRILAIDWGYSAMTYACWGAIAPDGRLIIYREYWAFQEKISTWASNIARLSQNETIRRVILDPSAWSNRGDEKTIAEQFAYYSGFSPAKADNDRLGGKMLIQEFLRWRQKPASFLPKPKTDFSQETADRILRIRGLDDYKAYLDSFTPEEPERDIPRLLIFDTCPKLIETIPLCVYPAKGTTQNRQSMEDVEEFDGDDPYDALRYMIKAADAYVKESASMFEELQRTDRVVKKFEEDGDTTAFYRRMEWLEHEQIGKNKPVMRYHHVVPSSYVQ